MNGDGDERITMMRIYGCVRCGNDHEIGFQRVEIPMGPLEYTHVGWCESAGAPVAMRIVQPDDDLSRAV